MSPDEEVWGGRDTVGRVSEDVIVELEQDSKYWCTVGLGANYRFFRNFTASVG